MWRNSLTQTVHTRCASVHQAAKLVAALLGVAGVTAGLAASLQERWVIGCHYFPPGPQLPSQVATLKRAATNFATWWTETWWLVVCYQHMHHIQNLRTTAVDCWSIWTSALKRVLYVSASCRNTGCKKTFTPLFSGTVNQLLINLVPFTVMIFTKRHNYVTTQRIFNRFCQNQITASWHIQLRIFAKSLIKIC